MGFRTPRERHFVRSEDRLRKVFSPDETAARDREAHALQRAAGDGVPELLAIGVDASNGRPWFDLAWAGEDDLRMRVGRDGPLPSAEVGRIGLHTAKILRRIHDLGILHGDVKPANLVLGDGEASLFLVDWEHAVNGSAQSRLASGFTGGTHGYAPPEAYLGRPPTASFDLFGLGATLHFALTGFPPPRYKGGAFDPRLLLRLRPSLSQDLLQPMRLLLSEDEAKRPTAEQLVRSFEDLRHGDANLEAALLAGRDYDDVADCAPLLEQRILWRRRLNRILQSIEPTSSELPARERVEGALRFCRAVWLCSSFVPLLPRARERIARAQERLPELLRSLPGEVQRLRQALEFVEARQLAHVSLDLCRLASLLVLPEREAPQLLESTAYAIQSALRSVEAGERKQRKILERLETAEADLDLGAANAALADLFESFSGANRSTARIRDRHQRFVWLLQRLVAGKAGIEEGIATLEEAQSKDSPHEPFTGSALRRTIERAAAALQTEATEEHRSLSLATRLFAELDQGWPRLQLGEAITELAELRRRASNRTADLVANMAERLNADPVPLRPLLRDLVEVDRILLLDCLVDTEITTRSALLDKLDKLRLRVEELSDQHRRLARGAREQLEQGRLTTALYDLERALEASAEDETLGAEEEIRLELEKVRRLRTDVRHATRRNLELAELFERLRDSSSGLDDRLRALEQREDVLLFLLENGAKPFRPRYSREIHELRILRLQELSADSERCYRAAESHDEQVAIAQSMLDRLDTMVSDTRTRSEDYGSRQDLLVSRWRDYAARALRDADDEREALKRNAQTRRTRVIALVAATGLLTALTLFVLTQGSGSVDVASFEEARSISAIEALRDRSEDSDVRDALGALAAALRAPKAERSAPLERVREALDRLEPSELKQAFVARLQLLEEKR